MNQINCLETRVRNERRFLLLAAAFEAERERMRETAVEDPTAKGFRTQDSLVLARTRDEPTVSRQICVFSRGSESFTCFAKIPHHGAAFLF